MSESASEPRRSVLGHLIDGFIVAGICAMAVLVLAQVFFRYVVSYSLPWSEEIATFLMMWVAMAGVVSLMRGGELISFEFLSRHPNRAIRKACRWISAVSILVFAAVLAVMGTRMSILSQSTAVSAAAELPMRWLYLVFVLGGAGLAWRALQAMRLLVRGDDRS
jgi:TRAP-type C4-dicarboxylate transport system permease small subunit